MAGATDTAIWCIQAGWTNGSAAGEIELTKAVAVALAQSDGNPGATLGLFGLGNVGDGPTQAKYAHEQVLAHGWDVFPAFRNKTYLIYIAPASVAVTTAGAAVIARNPGGFAQGVQQGVTDSLSQAAGSLPGETILDQAKTGISVLVKAGAWLGNADNWARILLVILGGGMVIGGVTLAAGSSAGGLVGAAGKAAGGAGKVVKAVAKG